MPRKSSAERAVVTPIRPRPHLAPSADAPADVKAAFAEILAGTHANHFEPGDAPLVQAYAEAICLARRAAIELDRDGPVIAGRTNPWLVAQEKGHRAMTALAARLRLSPQHRADSRSAGRKASGSRASVYETMGEAE
jgi:hypothetical protein